MARFTKISLLGLTFALLAAGGAWAGQSPQTGTFQVLASVPMSCRIVSTTDLDFGNYDPADVNFAADLDAQGAVSVRCVKGVAATVALDEGTNPAGASSCASPDRQMSDGTDLLRYQIFQDAARTQPWGCDPANTESFTSSSSSTAASLTTYGRIPAGQDVGVGSYLDTVTVTVTF